MVKRELIKAAFEQCKNAGITEAEVYYSKRKTTKINVADSEVDTYQIAEEEGLNISGNYQGYFSGSYVERMDEEAVREAVENLKATAKANGKTEKKSYLTGQQENRVTGEAFDIHQIAEDLKKVQEDIRRSDDRIITIRSTNFSQTECQIQLFGENGSEYTDSYVHTYAGVGLVVGEGDKKQDGYAGQYGKKYEDFDYNTLGKQALEQAVGLLHAEPVKSGEYEVVLEKHTAADIFSSFLPIFTAEYAKRGSSHYAGKEGEQVAAEILTMAEDPFLPTGPVRRLFDDEGIKTERKYLIHQGMFGGFLNSSVSSEGNRHTGNGFRTSYKTNVTTTAVNTYIEPGDRSTEEILKGMKEGLLITGADVFAGANPRTGDFSVISDGYLIRNGERVQAVNQITVGGNFYQMVKDIMELSSDTAGNGSEESYMEAPSVRIRGLKVGGL